MTIKTSRVESVFDNCHFFHNKIILDYRWPPETK